MLVHSKLFHDSTPHIDTQKLNTFLGSIKNFLFTISMMCFSPIAHGGEICRKRKLKNGTEPNNQILLLTQSKFKQ